MRVLRIFFFFRLEFLKYSGCPHKKKNQVLRFNLFCGQKSSKDTCVILCRY